MRGVMKDIGQDQNGPTVVYQDNLGTISWTEGVQGLRRFKNVGTKYHYVRSKVYDTTVKVLYKTSEDNKADFADQDLG